MCESTDSSLGVATAGGLDFVGPQTWAPVTSSPGAPQIVDIAAEADAAGARKVAALDALPSLLDTAVAYAEISLRRLRELAVLARAETVLDYEQLGGVTVALDLSHILRHLAGALDQVAGAQVLVARANVSAAAEELIDWIASSPTDPGSDPNADGGGEELEPDGFGGQVPERVTTYWQ